MEIEGKYDLLIIRNKYLKNSLEITEKVMNKAEPIFSKELYKRLGHPEPEKKIETVTPKKHEDVKDNINQKTYAGEDTSGEIIDAKKEKKDQNLKSVFKKIASKIHPDKLERLSEFEKKYKTLLFEKARIALESNDYYDIVEVAEELDIKPPPPNREQIELMKKTNQTLEDRLKHLQDSILWNWYHSDDEAKELLMSRYVEKLQQMHAGT